MVVGGAVAGSSVILDHRTAGDYIEDQNIKAKFSHLFYQDSELSEQTHINITSYNRKILITGETPTEQQKQKLNQIAERIKNVRHYFNEVNIETPSSITSRTNDSYITSKIKTAIFSQLTELNGAQVKVVTEQGVVFLMGLVSQPQAIQITEISRTISGVRRIIKLFEYPNPTTDKI
jgi:osmotically-inducible protein OsmY